MQYIIIDKIISLLLFYYFRELVKIYTILQKGKTKPDIILTKVLRILQDSYNASYNLVLPGFQLAALYGSHQSPIITNSYWHFLYYCHIILLPQIIYIMDYLFIGLGFIYHGFLSIYNLYISFDLLIVGNLRITIDLFCSYVLRAQFMRAFINILDTICSEPQISMVHYSLKSYLKMYSSYKKYLSIIFKQQQQLSQGFIIL